MTASKDGACNLDLDQLAEAWIALWQAELAALAADPDVAAAWQQALGLGAAWLRAARTAPGQPDDGGRPAPGAAAPGAAPGLFAGDPLGGTDAAALLARIDALERRLAALERGAEPGGAPRRSPRRKRPPA
ncbi:hypothetical protein [Paracraurococcus lichenis]|uniref:Poly(3-hydroxyalkanoate) polymerase subunit PhaE n=1 Tax=Paracraurococcus lichenis TaxID=3064888 RepID=A0ABT9DV99_9PROT|nr:hypothetical protein [Paracraurococcus sp. LOR1-02]MDO9707827.1 hypothetical protein [Paracraurococcus sp. LOR1-02]